MAYGLLEMGIAEFGAVNGRRIDTDRYNQALVRKYTLLDDRNDYIDDICSQLHTQLSKVLHKTSLDYPFAYEVLSSGAVLVGIDVRDLVELPVEQFEPTGIEEVWDEQSL